MANTDQQSFWSGQAGHIWVAQMDAMDLALAPVLDALLQRADIAAGEHILDLGCGAGSSTFRAAGAAGPAGAACGLDISDSLVTAARQRIPPDSSVHFILADGQTYAFEPEKFDLLMSRFGCMFFEDPVAAFANLARALKPGGRVCMASWGSIADNPYFTMPAAIAKSMLGPVPKVDPDGPGPFAFRDPARVKGILQDAGFHGADVTAVDMDLTPRGDLRQVAELLCEIGPAQRALRHFEVDDAGRARLVTALEAGLEAFATAQGIRIPARINIITARKGA